MQPLISHRAPVKAHNCGLGPVIEKGFDDLLDIAPQIVPVSTIREDRFSATNGEKAATFVKFDIKDEFVHG